MFPAGGFAEGGFAGERTAARSRASVERVFQFALLGLVASGFLALLGTGVPDRATIVLTFAGLALRGLMAAGLWRPHIAQRDVSRAALAYVVFFPVDYFLISPDSVHATMHGVCFLAMVKVLTARTNGDYVYTGAIAFMELVAAAILAANSNFFVYLALFLLCAIAVFTSGEIRNSLDRGVRAADSDERGMAWRLTGLALGATIGILVLTAGLFLAIPRTALMAARLFPATPRLTGFSDEIDLGGLGGIATDDRPVMHVYSERKLPDGLYWRGAALDDFDGMHWQQRPAIPVRVPVLHDVAVVASRAQLSRRDGFRMLYRVEMQNSGSGRLFIAGVPEFVNIDARFLIEGRGQSLRVGGPPRENLTYQVSAHSGPPVSSELTPEERGRDLNLRPLDMRIVTLAREWAGAGTDLQQAARIGRHLQRDYRYKLESSPVTVRDPLADFLFVRREGYCEYFASAMAVMLRSIGIPSRVVTGFYGGYHNDVSGLYVIRASDAHAWVEAWIDGLGWRTFDPTPPAAQQAAGLMGRLTMYLDAMDHAWREWVVSYDLNHQAAVAARLESMAHDLRRPHWGLGTFHSFDWKAAGWVLLGIVAIVSLWRMRQRARRTRGLHEAAILYSRMLKKLSRRGFEKAVSATPSEFIAELPIAERERVAEFTELYRSARFGADVTAEARMAELLRTM